MELTWIWTVKIMFAIESLSTGSRALSRPFKSGLIANRFGMPHGISTLHQYKSTQFCFTSITILFDVTSLLETTKLVHLLCTGYEDFSWLTSDTHHHCWQYCYQPAIAQVYYGRPISKGGLGQISFVHKSTTKA